MTDVSGLPEHVQVTTETTRKFACTVCRSRLILGSTYEDPDRAGQTLAEWLARHTHDPGPP